MFVNAKLNNNLKEAPAEVKENREYIHGGAILSAKDPCRFKFFVHRNLAFHKSIEVSYYSTKCVRLSSVCFYWGVMYGAELTNKDAIKELLKLHVDIRWIGTFCKIIRRTPVTRAKVSGKHLLHEVSNFQKQVKYWSHMSFGSFLSYKVLLCLHLNLHLIKTDDMSSRGLYYELCIGSVNLEIPKLYCYNDLDNEIIREIVRKVRNFSQCWLCDTYKYQDNVGVLTQLRVDLLSEKYGSWGPYLKISDV